MKKSILLLGFLLFLFEQIQAQINCCAGATTHPQSNISAGIAVNYADVGVDFARTSVDDSNPFRLKLTTVIENKNGNNTSRETRAIILLPGETRVISFRQLPANARKRVRIVQCGAILICTIDNLDPKSTGNPIPQTEVTIEVVTTKPTKVNAKCQANFGVMVYSKIPDSYLDDNYWKWHTDTERATLCAAVPNNAIENATPIEREKFRLPKCTNFDPSKFICGKDIGCCNACGLGKCTNNTFNLPNSLDFINVKLFLIQNNTETEIGLYSISNKDQIIKVPKQYEFLKDSQKLIVRVYPKVKVAFEKEFTIQKSKQ